MNGLPAILNILNTFLALFCLDHLCYAVALGDKMWGEVPHLSIQPTSLHFRMAGAYVAPSFFTQTVDCTVKGGPLTFPL